MSDRHSKWTPVEPGTVIPAGQPYRVEYNDHWPNKAQEFIRRDDFKAESAFSNRAKFFVDSSWKPPLDLPTEPTWGIAVRDRGKVLAEWHKTGNNFVGNVNGMNYGSHVADVLDFIPLTAEQVARIEAAR